MEFRIKGKKQFFTKLLHLLSQKSHFFKQFSQLSSYTHTQIHIHTHTHTHIHTEMHTHRNTHTHTHTHTHKYSPQLDLGTRNVVYNRE